MRKLIRRLLLFLAANAFAVWIVSEMFPEYFSIYSLSYPQWATFLFVGLVLGILNTFVKPLLKVVSFPFMIITLGLFLVVINALLIWITEWVFLEILSPLSITVEVLGGFIGYIVVGFSLAVINGIIHWILK